MKERVFTELTPEVESSAMLYAHGYEKKEIAEIKCRSVQTIKVQLNTAYEMLGVKNGRELTRLLYERLTGRHLTMSYNKRTREFIAYCLLGVFMVTFFENDINMQRTRTRRVERTERVIRSKR